MDTLSMALSSDSAEKAASLQAATTLRGVSSPRPTALITTPAASEELRKILRCLFREKSSVLLCIVIVVQAGARSSTRLMLSTGWEIEHHQALLQALWRCYARA